MVYIAHYKFYKLSRG